MDLRKMTKEDSIYLAALIDGEGCIFSSYPEKQHTVLNLEVSNTRQSVLAHLHEKYGGSLHCVEREEYKDCWIWNLGGQDTYKLLKKTVPYMRIKEHEAKIAVLLWENRENLDALNRLGCELRHLKMFPNGYDDFWLQEQYPYED